MHVDKSLLFLQEPQVASDQPALGSGSGPGQAQQASEPSTASNSQEGTSPEEKRAGLDLSSGIPQVNLYSAWGVPDAFEMGAASEALATHGFADEGEISTAPIRFAEEAQDHPSAILQQELQQRPGSQVEAQASTDGSRADAIRKSPKADKQSRRAKDPLLEGSLPRPRDDDGKLLDGGKRPPRLGQRWMNGTCFTISQTLVYAIDMKQGQIHDIKCTWEEVLSGYSNEQEAFDIYIQQAGLQGAAGASDSDDE